MSTMPPSGPGIPGGNVPPPVPPYQGGYPAGAYPPPVPQQPKKGLGPVAWILIILGGLFALFIVVIGVGLMFVAHKIHQAGKNPAIAIAKLAVAANPDAEIVSENDDRGTLTIHNRRTGKTVTINAGDVKNGKLTFTGDNNETVTFGASGSGNGSSGSFEVSSKDGTVRIGAGSIKLPSWLPAYPGATMEGIASSDTSDGSSGTFGYKTSDSPDKVMSFYKDAFTSGGLKQTANLTTTAMTMVSAEDETKKRGVNVIVSPGGGENTVRVTFTDKK